MSTLITGAPVIMFDQFLGTRLLLRVNSGLTKSEAMASPLKRFFSTLNSNLGWIRAPFTSSSSPIATQHEILDPLQKSNELYGVGMESFSDVERLLEITDFGDYRLKPKIEKARKSFTLALAYNPNNLDAALALSKIHLKFEGPAAAPISGVSLLQHAARNGLAEAQYDIFCRIRSGEYLPGIDFDEDTAFKFLKMAADQKHVEALFSLGVVHLTQNKNMLLAKQYFELSAEKGHSGAAMVLGAILLKEANGEFSAEESLRDLFRKEVGCNQKGTNAIENDYDSVKQKAKYYFGIAAENGEDLSFEWFNSEKIGTDRPQQ